MICPEGYFTPLALEAQISKAFENDRVAPRIFEAAGIRFDKVPTRDRSRVFEVSARMMLHRLVQKHIFDGQVYCPTLSTPLKTDSWIFQSKTPLPVQIPVNTSQADTVDAALGQRLILLNTHDWTVRFSEEERLNGVIARSQASCLSKIGGWSVCFRAELFALDSGRLATALARQIAQDAIESRRQQTRPGPKDKVAPLAEAILVRYDGEVPDKPVKQIERDLEGTVSFRFSETTLRSAIGHAKATQEQYSSC